MLQDIAIYKVINNFFPNAFESFQSKYETRLEVQKLIYLFGQLCGQNIYNHTWYYAGPYSPTLSSQIYNDILPQIQSKSSEWDGIGFTDYANNVLSKLESLIRDSGEIAPNFDKPRLYEAVASIWYIANNSTVEDNNNLNNDVLTKLVSEKPHLGSENIKALIDHVLVCRKELIIQDEEN